MSDNNELMGETLEELKIYLPKMIDASSNLTKLLGTVGKEKEAYDLFALYAEGLDWIYDACRLTQDCQQENNIMLEGEKISDLFKDLLEGWENEDFIMITDIIQYELSPILVSYYDLIKEVQFV